MGLPSRGQSCFLTIFIILFLAFQHQSRPSKFENLIDIFFQIYWKVISVGTYQLFYKTRTFELMSERSLNFQVNQRSILFPVLETTQNLTPVPLE